MPNKEISRQNLDAAASTLKDEDITREEIAFILSQLASAVVEEACENGGCI